jgi:hypothetical protein
MKIHVEAELFQADRWTDGRTDGRTDITKLIAAFRNCSVAPKNFTASGFSLQD